MVASSQVTPREFGESLRRARETAGVTLEEISERTKISLRVLRGIEEGEFSRLPSRVFARTFVRQIVERVGVPADRWVAQFDEAWDRFESSSRPDFPIVHAPTRGRRIGPWVVGLALVALAVVALIVVEQRQGDGRGSATPPTPAALLPILAPTPVATEVPPVVAAPAGEPVPQATSAGASPIPAPSTAAPPPASQLAASPPMSQPAVAAPAAGPGDLVLRTGGDECWAEVRVEGGAQSSRLLRRNETWLVPAAGRPVDLWLGNAGAVTVEYQGESRRPAGKPGEVMRLRLAPSRAASPTPAGQ